jgi:biopolymer transport protein ExbB/TolQ
MSGPQQAGTGKAEIPEINTRVISLPQKLDELAHELREMEDVSMELSFLAEVARALEEVRTTAESQLRQRNKALHWIVTNSPCDASRKAAAAALTEKP